jgi:phage shock protein A
MSILKRFRDIMASNINALLDKAEDPAKMVDQILRELNEDLGNVKAETAGIMAQEQKAKRELDDCGSEIQKMQDYAMKAVEKGNDEDARQFLAKKTQLVEKQTGLQQAYTLANENSVKMRQMHDKIVAQINELTAKRDAIKAKVAVAKAQEKVNKIGESFDRANAGITAFDRMEDKADSMLDKANAMAQLNQSRDSVEDLTKKYDSSVSEVEDELAALKRQMGK